ncbi:MAG: hypothetical protein NTW78_10720 [Campylobacterales bacterium]|nr:hypothetical protein [Campylobacterales bacterium]
MHTVTIDIPNESILNKILSMLNNFKSEGVVIREDDSLSPIEVENSLSEAVRQMNLIKEGKLKARPIEELLNEL